jgi:hypothetical protein
MSQLKNLLQTAIIPPSKFKVGDKVFMQGSDIPYVVETINSMSYDLVYDVSDEDYAKYRKIFDESFTYVDDANGLICDRVRILSSPHSTADIDKAEAIVFSGARWVVYENELIAR